MVAFPMSKYNFTAEVKKSNPLMLQAPLPHITTLKPGYFQNTEITKKNIL